MNDPLKSTDSSNGGQEDNSIQPLPGEAGIPNVASQAANPMSKKGLLAVALLIGSLVVVAGVSIARFASGEGKASDKKLASDRPMAAGSSLRRLDMAARIASAPDTQVPALKPSAEEVEPIPVRRTSQTPAGPKPMRPEDAPVLLVSSRPGNPLNAGPAQQMGQRQIGNGTDGSESPLDSPLDETSRSLEAYQRQLQGMLDNLGKSANAAGSPTLPGSSAAPAPSSGPGGTGLFGGQLQGSSTPKAVAGMLGNRSLTLPKGTAFTCALKTRVVSAASGFVGCQVQRNVYSDDGRVLLIERGSHIDGEYHIASVRPGTVRIPVLWTRIRTPNAVTVDIESPGNGQLGESGIDGHVDNRWVERIGAAMLLSLIDDSVKMVIQNQGDDRLGSGNTIVLPSTTANTGKLAEKVLESTINIPPLIYRNQGGIVGIYVARDVDFSSVYELKAVSR